MTARIKGPSHRMQHHGIDAIADSHAVQRSPPTTPKILRTSA
jgi:hypothetical protein